MKHKIARFGIYKEVQAELINTMWQIVEPCKCYLEHYLGFVKK